MPSKPPEAEPLWRQLEAQWAKDAQRAEDEARRRRATAILVEIAQRHRSWYQGMIERGKRQGWRRVK